MPHQKARERAQRERVHKSTDDHMDELAAQARERDWDEDYDWDRGTNKIPVEHPEEQKSGLGLA